MTDGAGKRSDFRVLGPLEIWHDGRQLSVSGAKQRALLALLLLHANEVVSSDRLVDALWPSDSLDDGRAALRVRMSQLRKALPAAIVTTQAPGYVLRALPDEIDLRRFERLAEQARRALGRGDAAASASLSKQALALWRGRALEEFAFEEFAQAAINRLEELRLAVEELHVEADLALGKSAELVPQLSDLVTRHPLRERLRLFLMLALYRSGRQADALACFQDARRDLLDGLGIEPGAALRDLERAILRHDPALLGPATQPAVDSRPRSTIVVAADADGDDLVDLGGALVDRPSCELILIRLVRDGSELASAASWTREQADALGERGIQTRVVSFTSARRGEDLVRLACEQEVDLVLAAAPESLLVDGVLDADALALLSGAPCDVAFAVPRRPSEGGGIVVPFSGVEHDWAAVELAAWMAAATGSRLHLVGADARRDRRDASRLLSLASLAIQRALGVTADPVLAAPGEDGVLAAAADASFLVVGLSDRWAREGVGPARLRLAREARATTLLVRRGLRPGRLAPHGALTRFTWSVAVRA